MTSCGKKSVSFFAWSENSSRLNSSTKRRKKGKRKKKRALMSGAACTVSFPKKTYVRRIAKKILSSTEKHLRHFRDPHAPF